jgi:hypothetical protein
MDRSSSSTASGVGGQITDMDLFLYFAAFPICRVVFTRGVYLFRGPVGNNLMYVGGVQSMLDQGAERGGRQSAHCFLQSDYCNRVSTGNYVGELRPGETGEAICGLLTFSLPRQS